jgi:hypothetical protein
MSSRISLIAGLLLFGLTSRAMADGRITQIDFSGPDDPTHPDVVQIVIEGGYSVAGCDRDFAAIRNDARRQHMINFAMAAYANGQSVKIVLNPNDKYYPAQNAPNGRCTIARISNR